jgi:anti-sigma B factor antagonist
MEGYAPLLEVPSLTERVIVSGTTVALNGEFDLAQRSRVLDAFGAVAGEPLVIIDLEQTQYIDSTMLSCLVRLRNDVAERGGVLALSGPRPIIRRLFHVAGLASLFEIYDGIANVCAKYELPAADLKRTVLVASDE